MAIMVEPESMCLFSCTSRSANIGLALASAFEAGAFKLNNSISQYSSRDKLMYITTTCLRDFNDAKLRAVAAAHDVAITCETESPHRSQIARLVHRMLTAVKLFENSIACAQECPLEFDALNTFLDHIASAYNNSITPGRDSTPMESWHRRHQS
jgi:hypothetical protein